MSTAKVIITKLTSTITKGGRTMQVGYVEKTDQWHRIQLSNVVESNFKSAVQRNMDKYKKETTVVALQ
jgi:hypothetical protein